MNPENNDNKSHLFYTALIFGAAIIMILISFFAQKHLDALRVSEVNAENVTLSTKAAQVSEENMQLVELNKSLRETNTKLTEEKTSVTLERDELLKEVAGYEALIEVYDNLAAGKRVTARSQLKKIYTEDLTAKQKEMYDELVKRAK